MGVNDINSLAHSKWNCKYHIVFAPKYRRMVFYGQKKHEVGKILRKLCEWKGVEVLNAEACPDHIHMLLSIPPKYPLHQNSRFLYLYFNSPNCSYSIVLLFPFRYPMNFDTEYLGGIDNSI